LGLGLCVNENNYSVASRCSKISLCFKIIPTKIIFHTHPSQTKPLFAKNNQSLTQKSLSRPPKCSKSLKPAHRETCASSSGKFTTANTSQQLQPTVTITSILVLPVNQKIVQSSTWKNVCGASTGAPNVDHLGINS
jgi:hypothetical protein